MILQQQLITVLVIMVMQIYLSLNMPKEVLVLQIDILKFLILLLILLIYSILHGLELMETQQQWEFMKLGTILIQEQLFFQMMFM